MKSERGHTLRVGTPKHQLDKLTTSTPSAKTRSTHKLIDQDFAYEGREGGRFQDSPGMKRFQKSRTPIPESSNLKTSGNKRFLNKTPYPTTFSNKKSQNYLEGDPDDGSAEFADNYGISNYTSNR